MKSEPVLTAGALAGVVMAALAMAVSLGWLKLDETQMGSIQAFLAAALGLAVPVAAAWWARSKVTPTANPHTEDGTEAVLVPKSLVSPQMMQQIESHE